MSSVPKPRDLEIDLEIEDQTVTMASLIEDAKVFCQNKVPDGTERRWLNAEIKPYAGNSNKIEIYVLEGSPARTIIIANYGIRTVKGIDACNKTIFSHSLDCELYKMNGSQKRRRKA